MFHQAKTDPIMWLNVKHEIPKLKTEWIVAIESNTHLCIMWQDHMVPWLEANACFISHPQKESDLISALPPFSC